jgi:hypothetical protein
VKNHYNAKFQKCSIKWQSIAIKDKFLPEEYKKKLLEVLSMTQIEEWIREEGKAEGKAEDARNALIEGIEPTIVARITGLPLTTIRKIKADLTITN